MKGFEMKIQGGASGHRGKAVAALGLLLALNACGLDKVEIPDYDGPAELATSVRLTATPDIITADGFSTSLIQVQMRGPNGENLAGRQGFVAVADDNGFSADIGVLRSTGSGGIGTGLVVPPGSNGIAQAAYEAPPRTDLTAHSSVVIQARPIGDDFAGQVYRPVPIELRAAEPRLFPQIPGNDDAALICNFLVEPAVGPYKVNSVVGFHSTSRDENGHIVRYEWFFGGGTGGAHPDEAKVYHFPGTYTVTHVVTDNGGLQKACATSVPVVPYREPRAGASPSVPGPPGDLGPLLFLRPVAANPRIDDLRKRLEKDPQSRLFAQLAEELRKAGELSEAIGVSRGGLQKHPTYPSARMTLGRAPMDSGYAHGGAR